MSHYDNPQYINVYEVTDKGLQYLKAYNELDFMLLPERIEKELLERDDWDDIVVKRRRQRQRRSRQQSQIQMG
jgi:DNA-binding PadR family transcriptional regulator